MALPDFTQPATEDDAAQPEYQAQAPAEFYQQGAGEPSFMPDVPLHRAAVDPRIEEQQQLQGQAEVAQQQQQIARNDRAQQTQRAQTNRVAAEDLRLRGIPTQVNASGDVSAVTDESGSFMTNFDPKNGIAYDSQGNAKAIKSNGLYAPPTVKDAFDGIPNYMDPKDGSVYERKNGLPWKWMGQDPEQTKAIQQAQVDKLNQQSAAALGGPISQYHGAFNQAKVAAMATAKSLIQAGAVSPIDESGAPVTPADVAAMDPEDLRQQVQQTFQQQLAAPEANDKHFFGGLTADAQATRDKIQAQQQAAMALVDRHAQNQQKMQQAQAGYDQLSLQQQALGSERIDSINAKRTALGLQPISLPDGVDRNQQTGAAPSTPNAETAPAAVSTPGMLQPGNIDLNNRPIVQNADGSISTVRSISIGTDNGEVLIPTVARDGSGILSDKDAIAQYKKTGENLGTFDNADNATAFAQRVHAGDPSLYSPEAIARYKAAENSANPAQQPQGSAQTSQALTDQQKAGVAAAQAGQRAYVLDPKGDGTPQFQHGQLVKGIQQGIEDGVIDPDKAKTILPDAVKADQQYADLIAAAGDYPKLKAFLDHGLKSYGSFAAGAAASSAVTPFDPELAAAGAPLGGVGAAILPLLAHGVAFLAGNYLSRKAVDALQTKISEYSDTVNSLEASSKLEPGAAAMGDIAGALPAAGRSLINLGRIGSIEAADAGWKAAAASAGQRLATGAGSGAAFELAVRPAFDWAVQQGRKALGMQDEGVQAPTVGSVTNSAILGAILTGEGFKFKNYDANDIAGLYQKWDTAKSQGIDPNTVISPVEKSAMQAAQQKLTQLKADGGTLIKDPDNFSMLVRQAITPGGSSQAVTADIKGVSGNPAIAGLPGANPSSGQQKSQQDDQNGLSPAAPESGPRPSSPPRSGGKGATPPSSVQMTDGLPPPVVPASASQPGNAQGISSASSTATAATAQSQPQSDEKAQALHLQNLAAERDILQSRVDGGSLSEQESQEHQARIEAIDNELASAAKPVSQNTVKQIQPENPDKTIGYPYPMDSLPKKGMHTLQEKDKEKEKEEDKVIRGSAEGDQVSPQIPTEQIRQELQTLQAKLDAGTNTTADMARMNVLEQALASKPVAAKPAENVPQTENGIIPTEGNRNLTEEAPKAQTWDVPQQSSTLSAAPESETAAPSGGGTVDTQGAVEPISNEPEPRTVAEPAGTIGEANRRLNRMGRQDLMRGVYKLPMGERLAELNSRLAKAVPQRGGQPTDIKTGDVVITDQGRMKVKATDGRTTQLVPEGKGTGGFAIPTESLKANIVQGHYGHVPSAAEAQISPPAENGVATVNPDAGEAPKAADLIPQPALPEPKAPPEHLSKIAAAHGLSYHGMQEAPEGKYPLHLFTDPKTGSTLSMPVNGAARDLGSKIRESRKAFNIQVKVAPAASNEKRGSTQVNIPEQEAKPILDFVKSIPASELYEGDKPGEYGRETEPHVTALYGLTGLGDDVRLVKGVAKKHSPIDLTLGKMSVFSNPDSHYDVLKLDVESPGLHAMNASLKNLPYKSDFPNYHPHLTLAYLKKGQAQKYVGDTRFEGEKITIPELTHSSAERVKTKIALTPKQEDNKTNGSINQPATPELSGGDDESQIENRAREGVAGQQEPDAGGDPAGADAGERGLDRGGAGGGAEVSDLHRGEPAGLAGGDGESGGLERAGETGRGEPAQELGRVPEHAGGKQRLDAELAEKVVGAHEPEFNKLGYSVDRNGRGKFAFSTNPETKVMEINPDLLERDSKIVVTNGGDPGKWLTSVMDEELQHARDMEHAISIGEKPNRYFLRTYGRMSKPQREAIKSLYQVAGKFDPNARMILMGGEWLRAKSQVERGIELPEAQYKPAAAKAFVDFVKGQSAPETPAAEQKPKAPQDKKIDFNIYGDRFTKDVFIGKKATNGVVRLKTGFPDAKQARQYIADNRTALEEQWTGLKAHPDYRRPINAPRQGPERRESDVTPEKFQDAFGFRGVQFGNWVEGDRRQVDINEAFDALMDMSDALGVPAKALSLDGSLGLAFGARGSGGVDAAKAHYEPGEVVINLTKKTGPGSLAHEWFHGFDNYFARLDKTGETKPQPLDRFATQHPKPAVNMRPEVWQAFKQIRDALDKGTFAERSTKLDEARSKPYYGTTIEKAARAFEKYVVMKLEAKKISNDYLVNIRKEFSPALPTDKEMKDEIAGAYDHLFNILDTKETGKGLMLHAQKPMSEDEKAVAENFREKYRELLQKGSDLSDPAPFQLGRTPKPLQLAGLPDGPMFVKQQTLLQKPNDENHPFPPYKLTRLPELLHDPILVHESWTHPDAYVALMESSHGGKNMVGALHFQTTPEGVEVTEVASIYPRDHQQIEEAFRRTEEGREGAVTYWNKEKARQWLNQSSGFHSPQHWPPLFGRLHIASDDDISQGESLHAQTPVATKEESPFLKVAQGIASLGDDIQKLFAPASREGARPTAQLLQESASKLARSRDLMMEKVGDLKHMVDKLTPDMKREILHALDNNVPINDPGIEKAFDELRKADAQRMDWLKGEFKTLGLDHFDNFEHYERYIIPHLAKDPLEAERKLRAAVEQNKKTMEGSKGFLEHRDPELKWTDMEAMGIEPASDNPVEMVFGRWMQQEKYLMAQRMFKEMEGMGAGHWENSDYEPTGDEVKIDHRIGVRTHVHDYTLRDATDPASKSLADGIKRDLARAQALFEKAASDESKQSIQTHIDSLNRQLDEPVRSKRKQSFYVPEAAARVINNYLSPGLRRDHAWFRQYLSLGNAMNQAQLGFSFFHAGFTAMDTMVSKLSLAIGQLIDGKPVDALRSFVEVPISSILTPMRGHKVLKEWYAPGSQSEDIRKVLEAAIAGGARAGMDPFYQNGMIDKMMASFRNGGVKGFAGGILRAPFALTELMAKPVMEFIVPRMKMGVIAEMLRHEMDAHPNMTHEELRAVADKVVRSADNRLGQMTYENLHLDKVVKDLGMASVRSLGWNLGTFRELGGGLYDWMRAATSFLPKVRLGAGGGGNGGGGGPGGPKENPIFEGGGIRIIKGHKPEFTYRMAYTIALPLLVGAIGAIIQKALTGKDPENVKDLMFPRVGGLDKNGAEERVALPSYMKDVGAYLHSPTSTLTNKMHPMLSTIGQMLRNSDYYGIKIRNEDDPIIKQAIAELKFVGKAGVPFSVTNFQQIQKNQPLAEKIGPFIGVTPAAAYIKNSAAQNLATQLMLNRIPQGARTAAEAQHSQIMRDLSVSLRQGDRTPLMQAMASHAVSPKDVKTIQARAGLTPLQYTVGKLPLSDAQQVFKLATPGEKLLLRGIIARKQIAAAGTQATRFAGFP